MPPEEQPSASVQALSSPEPGRLVGRGHVAGDLLEAYKWDILEEGPGLLRVSCHLPSHLKNPFGQLFGGFTPAYVDMLSLLTVRAGRRQEWASAPTWMATSNMRIDYFEPILGPRFEVESRLEKRRGRTNFVASRFIQDGELAVHALTTMRATALPRSGAEG